MERWGAAVRRTKRLTFTDRVGGSLAVMQRAFALGLNFPLIEPNREAQVRS